MRVIHDYRKTGHDVTSIFPFLDEDEEIMPFDAEISVLREEAVFGTRRLDAVDARRLGEAWIRAAELIEEGQKEQ